MRKIEHHSGGGDPLDRVNRRIPVQFDEDYDNGNQERSRDERK